MRAFDDKRTTHAGNAPADYACDYQSGALRCKYPGTIGLSTLGGRPLYCRIHIRERGTLIAQQALEASQNYRPPVIDDDPCDDPNSWLARNFPMRPGESRHEYNQRCKAYALAMLGRLRVKPVAVPPRAVSFGEPERMREPGEDLVEM